MLGRIALPAGSHCAALCQTVCPSRLLSCLRACRCRTALHATPASCTLFLPQVFLELPKIMNDPNVKIDPLIFLSNAGAAFGVCGAAVGGAAAAAHWEGGGVMLRALRLAAAARHGPVMHGGLWRPRRTLLCALPLALLLAGLNMAVFLLIGKTSALTMNIAGVVKDWILIFLSYLIYQ